ncbi:MAG: response regulator [Candidatus Hodarchaeales archaeon]|jgi:DNA-binding NtrC family response regulator
MVRILIVEDEPSIQFFYKKILTINGFEVAGVANNSEEAVSIYKSLNEKPDVILMDHRMPEKNGIDASREIFRISSNQKIIFVSADNSIKEEADSIGVFSFLEKPFNFEILINHINRAIKV